MIYVDDDTDNTHESDPNRLKELIEQEAQNSATWLHDNKLCVADDKSKLLVIGTRQLRKQKLKNWKMSIKVDGKDIEETDSEKLLGAVVNNEMAWKNHLHGDTNNTGLITQLSQRIGILKKLSRRMNKARLKVFASGIFYSKLQYCLPVFGNVFGLEKYRDTNNKFSSFTKSDNKKLQVLQNSLMLTESEYKTPTEELLEKSDSLSIQQMIALQTLTMTYKIIKTGKPTYLAERLKIRNVDRNIRGSLGTIQTRSHGSEFNVI